MNPGDDVTHPILGSDAWRVIEGDAADVLPSLGVVDHDAVVITDPPWPEGDAETGWASAAQFGRVAPAWEGARRVVVHLGAFTDPRMLGAMPSSLPFDCVRWLRYTPPSYCGTRLRQADVAYIFGERERPHGATVAPAEAEHNTSKMRDGFGHPCSRSLQHLMWLVRWFTQPEDLVIDPFCGTGVTGEACARLGRRFIGIDIDPRWVALSRERLTAAANGSTLAAARAGQHPLFAGSRSREESSL